MTSISFPSDLTALVKAVETLAAAVESNNRLLTAALARLGVEPAAPKNTLQFSPVTREPSRLLAIARSVLEPYASNANTGNYYEIATALDCLRRMGLTDKDLAGLEDVAAAIAKKNTKKETEIAALFTNLGTKPVGTGFTFDGKAIVGLKNMTQDDSTTGDLLLVDTDGATHALSVTGGAAKRRDGALTIEKCLTNPSAKRFGCTPADIEAFKAIRDATIPKYKAEMTEKYSADEACWARKTSDAAVESCTQVAASTVERYSTLPSETQLAVIKDLLQISTDCKKPADYLALVNPSTLEVTYYAFDDCRIDSWCPQLKAAGINIEIYANATQKIGSTQVKFNNGVWHNGKTSDIHSSWNSTFYLTDLFRMRPCPC
jgi:hypothetical protein